MKDDRDESTPSWLRTAVPSNSNGGILARLAELAEPDVEPWNDLLLGTYPETPWKLTRPLYPFLQPPSNWDSSSPALPHMPVGVDTGFPAPPAEPVVRPWDDPRRVQLQALLRFGLPAMFSPVPPLEHLDSGKYWPVAPAPSGALLSANGSYSPPMPHAPSWDQVAGHPTDSAAPKPPIRPFGSTPAGIADGGQRTSGGSAENDPQVLSDAEPENNWLQGMQYAGVGHHHNPRAVFRKFALPPETRQVFDKATTGPLPFHGWHQYDELHRLYSNAVEDLMNRFMQEHNIKAQQMTPDHARSVLRAIAESEDVRIRAFRAMLQHMGRLYRLRTGGRGSE